jgi:flagellar biosynthesis/type III secretory pathway protein FliH
LLPSWSLEARERPNIAKMMREKEKESNMPFILDREIDPLYQEGVEKGIEKGKTEAMKETKIAIAKTMLLQKLPWDMIVFEFIGIRLKF